MIKPQNLRNVVLDGTTESEPVRIPRGATRVAISPIATTTIRIAYIDNNTQSAGNYFSLINGQPFEFDCPPGESFEEFDLFFYAAIATSVDVVWW